MNQVLLKMALCHHKAGAMLRTNHGTWFQDARVVCTKPAACLMYKSRQDAYVLNACDTTSRQYATSVHIYAHLCTSMHYAYMPSKGAHLISACLTIV